MKKIDGVTAGPNNTFLDYNPGAGIGGTILTADWLNINREEIINVIEGAGLTLDANDDTQLSDAIQAIIADYVGGGIPGGGTTNQALVKTNLNTDNAATWQTFAGLTGNVPTGGTTGQLLKKVNSTDYNTTWGTVAGLNGSLPTGGTTNQLLAKNSGTNYDAGWLTGSTLGLLPTGGAAGNLLAKNSGTNYDTVWRTLTQVKGAKYALMSALLPFGGILENNKMARFATVIASSGLTVADTSDTDSGVTLASGSTYLIICVSEHNGNFTTTSGYGFWNITSGSILTPLGSPSASLANIAYQQNPNIGRGAIVSTTIVAGSGQKIGIRGMVGDSYHNNGSVGDLSTSDFSQIYLYVVSIN